MSECRKFITLVSRNTKCYFKDKFTFFISLLNPLILLLLFVTFLRNVYIESFTMAFPESFSVDNRIIEGIAGAWLMSSIIGVSSVTVAFCSNTIMILRNLVRNALCGRSGKFYFQSGRAFRSLVARNCVVRIYLRGVYALGTVFRRLAQRALYAPRHLRREHTPQPLYERYLDALSDAGIPSQAIDGIMKSFDAKIYLFGTEIPLGAMYGILMGACALSLVAYIAIVIIKNKRK